jgi:glycosyltransferase involved in cell wall biosynthesis
VIIPAFNEAATVAEVVGRVPRSLPGVGRVEVVVVDDGSTDATAERARAAGAAVVGHPVNRGLGLAIQTGLGEALRRGAQAAINLDADGQFAPEDIPRLLAPIIDGQVDFVTASRFKDPALTPRMPKRKVQGNRFLAWAVSRLTGQAFTDVSCGFRAYSEEALLRLVLSGRYTYTHETFLTLALKGLRIREVPVQVRGEREVGPSKVAASLWRYGWQTGGIILAWLRDYLPVRVFNLSAVGLLLPGLLLGLFFWLHFLLAGTFSPHIWAGFSAAALLFLGLLVFLFGQLAAMLGRLRTLEEEQLYLLRKAERRACVLERSGAEGR